jgi:ubiquinone/menaquinone biosynthesis C-methylase UbiE
MQERERKVLTLLKREGFSSLEKKKILEIGCGNGHWLREFIKWGAQPNNITGLDLLPDRVSEARKRCPAQVRIECRNAAAAELPDAAFDLVLQSTAFTSILDSEMKRGVAAEMLRVLHPNGIILWYDFHVSNPRNPDVGGIKAREICRLFPTCRVKLQRVTLAPPLRRAIAPYSWSLCYVLSKLPWLCTHYLAVIRKG